MRNALMLLAMLCAVVLLVAPHAWPFTSDTARAAHTIVYTALVWPIIACDSAPPARLAALLLASLGAVHHSFVLGINVGEYYPHVIPGILLLRGGVNALRSRDCLPVAIGVLHGASALAVLLVMALGQWYKTLRNQPLRIAHFAHELMYVAVACIVLSGTLQSVLAAPRAARMAEARRVLDPAAFAALGVLFLSHIHDKSAMGIGWHTVLGWALIANGAVMVLAGLVHAHAPRASAARLASALVAFGYVVPGVWLLHMAAFHYLFGRGWHNGHNVLQGVHHLLFPDESNMDLATLTNAAKAREFIGVYLTVDMLVAAWLVSLASIWLSTDDGWAASRLKELEYTLPMCSSRTDSIEHRAVAPDTDGSRSARELNGLLAPDSFVGSF